MPTYSLKEITVNFSSIFGEINFPFSPGSATEEEIIISGSENKIVTIRCPKISSLNAHLKKIYNYVGEKVTWAQNTITIFDFSEKETIILKNCVFKEPSDSNDKFIEWVFEFSEHDVIN